MTNAIVDVGTTFKLEPFPAEELPDEFKLFVPQGRELEVADHLPERSQHRWIKLAEPLTLPGGKQETEFFVYDPHVFVEGETEEPIKLKVPYFRQIDNATRHHGPGWRQCNLTSHAMLIEYITNRGSGGDLRRGASRRGFSQPESSYGEELVRFGDTVDHQAHTRCLLETYGIESYWSKTLCLKDILMSLRRNIPVVLGVAYKRSGHIVIAVGADVQKEILYIHDPYGIRFGASDRYDTESKGDFDPYSFATLDRIFWDYGPEDGWGRIVTAIRGVPTGMPKGL